MAMRDRITFVFWLLVCVFFCIESARLGIGSIQAPGPGFMAFWVSIIMILLVIVHYLNVKGKKILEKVEPFFEGRNVRGVIYGTSFIFAFALLFETMGFVLCTALFLGACLKVIGKKSWWTTIYISLSATLISYLIFVAWLKIEYPQGRFLPF